MKRATSKRLSRCADHSTPALPRCNQPVQSERRPPPLEAPPARARSCCRARAERPRAPAAPAIPEWTAWKHELTRQDAHASQKDAANEGAAHACGSHAGRQARAQTQKGEARSKRKQANEKMCLVCAIRGLTQLGQQVCLRVLGRLHNPQTNQCEQTATNTSSPMARMSVVKETQPLQTVQAAGCDSKRTTARSSQTRSPRIQGQSKDASRHRIPNAARKSRYLQARLVVAVRVPFALQLQPRRRHLLLRSTATISTATHWSIRASCCSESWQAKFASGRSH